MLRNLFIRFYVAKKASNEVKLKETKQTYANRNHSFFFLALSFVIKYTWIDVCHMQQEKKK